MAEKRQVGVYNLTGPDYTLTFGELFRTIQNISNSEATFTWVNKDFLEASDVQPWSNLPLWLPADTDDAYWAAVDISKALETGLTFRPLNETVKDTLDWANSRSVEHTWRAGLTAEREKELLAAWHDQKS
jgi:2'-hydroxyisoflavone reductase